MDYHPDWQSLSFEGVWTTTPPTEPGFYWVKWEVETEDVDIVGMYSGEGGLEVWWEGAQYKAEAITHWLGPLPGPKAPGP